MLTQIPDNDRMEYRSVVEGAFMGFGSRDDLIDTSRRAGLSEEDIGQLTKALDQKSPLVQIGVLILDSQQLRILGFQTLARMIEAI
jgi:hypothetical protein